MGPLALLVLLAMEAQADDRTPTWTRHPDATSPSALSTAQEAPLGAPSPAGGRARWYRTTVSVDPHGDWAVLVEQPPDRRMEAWELWADGAPLHAEGAVGADRLGSPLTRAVPVPRELTRDGAVQLDLHASDPREAFPTAPARVLPRAEAEREAQLQVLALRQRHAIDPFGAGFFVFAALYHLASYSRRPDQRAYLWVALLCLGALLVNLTWTGLIYEWPLPSVALFQLNIVGASTAIAAYLSFAHDLVGQPAGRVGRALQAGTVAGTVLVVGVAPDLLTGLLGLWLLTLIVGTWTVLASAVAGHPDARSVAAGLVGFATLLGVSIADSALGWLRLPEGLLPITGFAVLLLSMAVALANRFERTHRALDALRIDLEARVAERTEQLAAANLRLSRFNEELSARVRAQLEEIVRGGRLRRYFPKSVLERILLSDEDVRVETERQLVTVMFTDLTGFTAYSESAEPHEVARTLNAYLRAMVDTIEQHGGTIDKVMGDGIMALWGAPTALDAGLQAQQSVEAALAMQRRMGALTATWHGEGMGHTFRIRIGLHQDVVAVGNIGTADLLTYTAIGRGVNLAARLESTAPPGGVHATEAVVRATVDLPWDGPHPRQLKGVAEPVSTWILPETWVQSATPARAPHGDSPGGAPGAGA